MDVETEPSIQNDASREQMKTSIDVTKPEKNKDKTSIDITKPEKNKDKTSIDVTKPEKNKDKTSIDVVKPEKIKDTQNHKHLKSKRSSRSRTPQKKHDEPKILHFKQKIEAVNGKEAKEETKDEPLKIDNGKDVSNKTFTKTGAVKEPENGEPAQIESVRESTSEAENDNEKPVVNDNVIKSDNCIESQTNSELTIKHDSVEMDPLVISDEVDPELAFLEENSDRDSGKASPLMTRCSTRRSYTRNIPTPKTPKVTDQETDSEKNSVADQSEEICNLPNDIPLPKTDTLNETKDSLDVANMSTKVEVGSDATRLNFTQTSIEQDQSFINSLRTRRLVGRRPIRATEDYIRKVLKNTQNKSDLNEPYEQITTGVKRKNNSLLQEESKKFRDDEKKSWCTLM